MSFVSNGRHMTVEVQLIVNNNSEITCFILLAQYLTSNGIFRNLINMAVTVTNSMYSTFVKSYFHLPFVC